MTESIIFPFPRNGFAYCSEMRVRSAALIVFKLIKQTFTYSFMIDAPFTYSMEQGPSLEADQSS
jgi:hypothetical protein